MDITANTKHISRRRSMQWLKIFLVLFIVSWMTSLQALLYAEPMEIPPQEPATAWPDVVILPWQPLNIDRDQIAKSERALAMSQTELANTASSNPRSLLDGKSLVAGNDLNGDLFKEIFAGAFSPAAQTFKNPIALMPVWGNMQGRQVLLLIVATSDTNIILATSHRIISGEAWRNNLKRGTTSNVFSPQLAEMWQEILSRTFTQPKPDLAIGFGLGAVSSRGNEVERNILNILTAEQHLKGFTIINPIGSEILASIHRSWSTNGILRRPNRMLTMRWMYDRVPQPNTTPISLNLTIQASDAVFAQPLPWSVQEKVSISIDAGSQQLSIGLSSKLRDMLSIEEKSLLRSENPIAAKIRGAWVYLDKGRAWGLRMNDRLVIQDGSQSIKGHIVSYFGPELKLMSPRGWPIHEGAIMFVRKGQSASRIGQEFIYDKMTVPTPWPPQSSSQGQGLK